MRDYDPIGAILGLALALGIGYLAWRLICYVAETATAGLTLSDIINGLF